MKALRIVVVFIACFTSTLSASGNGDKKAPDVSQATGSSAASLIIVPNILFEISLRTKSQAAITDWEVAGLKGRIESFNTEVATPVQGSGSKWINQTSTWSYSHTYDSRGNLIEQVYIFPRAPDTSQSNKQVYSYDEKGNRTEMATSSSDGYGGAYQYTYDSNGSLSEMVGYSLDGSMMGKTAYRYDEKLNQVETTTYNPDGSVLSTSVISFDEKGRKTIIVPHQLDKQIYSKTTYTYENNRTRIENTQYDLKDEPFEQYVTVFDNSGNLIEESFYRNGVLSRKTVPIYNYDQRGNWILRIDQTIVVSKGMTSNEPPTVHYRTIEYLD